MDLHQNARLSFRSRETLAKKIMIERLQLRSPPAEKPPLSGSAAIVLWGYPACRIVPRDRGIAHAEPRRS